MPFLLRIDKHFTGKSSHFLMFQFSYIITIDLFVKDTSHHWKSPIFLTIMFDFLIILQDMPILDFMVG